MVAVITERLKSCAGTKGRDPSRTKSYMVTGAESETLAVAMADAYAPVLYGNLVKQNLSFDPGEAPDIWYIDVQYGQMQPKEPGKVQWQFNAGGMTTHITHGLAHVQSYFASGSGEADPHDGAINVRKDGNGELVIDGVDIGGAGGGFTWSETHWLPYASFTPAYVFGLYAMVVSTPVNSTAWRVWSAGEVRLLTISGSASGEDQVELNFNFAANPNLTGLTKGTITGIDKKGWDYMWMECDTGEDTTAKRLAKKITAVHVEQVYGYGDFTSLGLVNVPWG